jgi:hypothetical protein
MRRRSRRVLDIINDAALLIPGGIAVTIASIDFLDLWDKIPIISRDRMLTLVLLCCGLIVIGIVLERRVYLASIQETLISISFNASGVESLENPQVLNTELERAIKQSDQSILVVGAKSRLSPYLNVIKESVLNRDVIYKRLIDGTYIPHELHEHLLSLINDSRVRIAWTPREKFGNFTVTDNECIFAFPSVNLAKFFGIRICGQKYTVQMKEYFYESFNNALPVPTAKALNCLCEKCSPKTARNAAEINAIIKRELSQ